MQWTSQSLLCFSRSWDGYDDYYKLVTNQLYYFFLFFSEKMKTFMRIWQQRERKKPKSRNRRIRRADLSGNDKNRKKKDLILKYNFASWLYSLFLNNFSAVLKKTEPGFYRDAKLFDLIKQILLCFCLCICYFFNI